MTQQTRPQRRTIIAPGTGGRFNVFVDDPDGLIWLDFGRTQAEALAKNPGAIVLPAIWDAPIIDPADPSTHPDYDPADPVELSPDDFHW